MASRLDEIESRLRELVEERLNPLGRPDLVDLLAHQLVTCMHAEMTAGEDGRAYAPAGYSLHFHPERMAEWETRSSWVNRLAESLQTAALESGIHMVGAPFIRLLPDPSLAPSDLRVSPLQDTPAVSQTAAFPLVEDPRMDGSRRQSAFLILPGGGEYPLVGPVINIGRRGDNHLMIEDPRVSRAHAQIRLIRGDWVVFDLNSTGGTLINGLPVRQHTLRPGDVISLAGVALVYGEETTRQGGTSPEPPAGEKR